MAAAPLTSGVAIEVPLRVATAVGLAIPALFILCPGAKTFTHLP